MTKYCGGKSKIAQDIHDEIVDIENNLIENRHIKKQMDYLEPFCGMASVALQFAMDKEDDSKNNRKITISDLNNDIVEFWKGMKSKIKPPKYVSETEYNKLKNSTKSSFKKTYVGFEYSFGAGFYAGYNGRYMSSDKMKTAGINCYNKILDKQSLTNYIDVKTTPKEYTSYNPKNLIIYLDPPYKGTKQTTNNDFLKDFDTDEFWDIATKWNTNNLVFISEVKTNIPKKYKNDYTIVWCKKTHRSVSLDKSKSKNECLFLHNSWYELLEDDDSSSDQDESDYED